jgi:hypothetical protein
MDEKTRKVKPRIRDCINVDFANDKEVKQMWRDYQIRNPRLKLRGLLFKLLCIECGKEVDGQG